jgi:hypothetical protein
MYLDGFGASARHVGAVLYIACQLTTGRCDVIATGFAYRGDDASR